MIGNDLVFWPEMNIPSGNRFERYLDKVFLDEEQEWIRKAKDKQLAMAWLWSVKESAYKIWAKRTRDRKWNPKQFFVKNYSEALPLITMDVPKSGIGFKSLPIFQSHIKTPLGTMWGRSLFYPNYIASYAVDSEEDWKHVFWENDFFEEMKLQSARVREIYQKRLFSTQKGFQTLTALQKTTQIDLSFSHDGPMIGYAFTINQTLNNEFRSTERTIKS